MGFYDKRLFESEPNLSKKMKKEKNIEKNLKKEKPNKRENTKHFQSDDMHKKEKKEKHEFFDRFRKKESKLPKNPVIGERYNIQTRKGIVEFEAQKTSGFGKYKIISHKKH